MIEFIALSKKYNTIFHPFGLESLYHLANYVQKQNKNKTYKEIKILIIQLIKFLIEKKIIFILEPNWMKNDNYNKIELKNDEIIKNIHDKLDSSTNIDELYDFFWFKYQDWYRIGLENKGLTVYTTNWDEFIINRIEDLELWIEENKPKE